MSPEPSFPDSETRTAAAAGKAPDDGKASAGSWHEIEALANAVRALHHQESRGDLAALRRMDTRLVAEPAFHRILARTAPDAARGRAQRIALLTRILALATRPDMLRDGGRRLGEALHVADVSEARVQMLMTARGAALDDLLLRTARRLVRDGLLPYQDIGKLILGGPRTVEDTRFRIAKAYWARGGPATVNEQPNAEPEPVAGEDE